MQDLDLDKEIIENNVLFFLQKNHKDSTDEQVKQALKDSFAETEIIEAKLLLAGEPYLTLLTEYDEVLGISLKTKRRNTKNKKNRALDAIILDIMNAIDAIEACEKNKD